MGENSNNTASRREVLGTAPIGGLMFKFAVPSIIAMLVSALYNIVDQIFIGQAVGTETGGKKHKKFTEKE